MFAFSGGPTSPSEDLGCASHLGFLLSFAEQVGLGDLQDPVGPYVAGHGRRAGQHVHDIPALIR